jgi:hypothetical protein
MSSTQSGTICDAGPWRAASNRRAPAEFHIQLQRPGARRAGLGHQTGGGIDRAAGTDGHEQGATRNGAGDLRHAVRNLAEPHHIGAHAARPAFGAFVGDVHVAVLPPAGVATGAEGAAQLSVHVDQAVRRAAAAFVQVVDVLGDDQHLAGPRRLQARQRDMGGVGRRGHAPRPARVIEPQHEGWIGDVGVHGRHLVQRHASPDPARVAERAEAAFSGHPRAGQNHDLRRAGHRHGRSFRRGWAFVLVARMLRQRARPC